MVPEHRDVVSEESKFEMNARMINFTKKMKGEEVPVGTMGDSLDINYISVFLRRQTQAYINSFGVCKTHLSALLNTSNLSCQQHAFLGAAVQDHKDYK